MRLLKGARDAWKLGWQLVCRVLFQALSSRRGNPHGGSVCGWMKYVCQDSKPAIPCGSIYKHARSA
jgi:hypothetical protein